MNWLRTEHRDWRFEVQCCNHKSQQRGSFVLPRLRQHCPALICHREVMLTAIGRAITPRERSCHGAVRPHRHAHRARWGFAAREIRCSRLNNEQPDHNGSHGLEESLHAKAIPA